jgi:3-hydroxybutyryl-CoA dehydrogenase
MKADQLKKITIIGSGIMGIGIAQNFAQAGFSVVLVDMDRQILDNAVSQIKTNLQLFKEYDLIQEDPSAVLARINTFITTDLELAMQDCHYVVEAIPENIEIKKALFARLDRCSPQAIIASNSSSFTVDELVPGLKEPGRVVGVHYFNPAHIMPVVEIHRGTRTNEETVNLARNLMLKVGKKPVMVKKVLPGFIVNRLTGSLEREIGYLLDEGVVTTEDLDMAVKGTIGFRLACMGPQQAEDMIGLDTSMRVSTRIFKVLSNATEPSSQLVAKVKAGDLGIKSGKGWYDYSSKPKNELLDETNRKLLQQLALFNARENSNK